LGVLYEGNGEYDKAIEQYKALLALSPNDPIGLNNLAYGLAVHRNQPREALPIAQRAFKAAGANPTIVDTLAWVHHLLGNDAEAARLLTDAVKQETGSADIRVHAAIVFDAVGRTAD